MPDFIVDSEGRITDIREKSRWSKDPGPNSSGQDSTAENYSDSTHSVFPANERQGIRKKSVGLAVFFAAVSALIVWVLLSRDETRQNSLARVGKKTIPAEKLESLIESPSKKPILQKLGAQKNFGISGSPKYPARSVSSMGPKESLNPLGICENPASSQNSEPILEQTVKAWEEAGAKYLWLDVHGRYQEKPTPGAWPGFVIEYWKSGMLNGLPAPSSSFFLDLSGTKITDSDLDQLQKFEQLASLNLSKTAISDIGLEALSRLEQLTSLELSRTEVNGSGIKALARLENLITLGLGFSKINDEGLRDIGLLTNLKMLSLGHYLQPKNQIIWSSNEVSDSGIRHLATLKNLEALCLYRSKVDDEGLKELVVHKQLKFLCLYSTKVTSGCIKTLTELENLTSLVLSCDIEDAEVKDLSQLKKLKLLQLYRITDGTLQKLSESGLLHTLSRAQTEDGQRPKDNLDVVKFDLSGTCVSDKCFELVKNFPNLRKIDLRIQRMTYGELKDLIKKYYHVEIDYDDRTLQSEVPDEEIDKKREGFYRRVVPRRVTTEGISELLELNHLTEIHLEQRQLTESLLSLFCLKSKLHLLNQATTGNAGRPKADSEIIRLDLSGARVPSSSIKVIEMNLPNCKVIVDSFFSGLGS